MMKFLGLRLCHHDSNITYTDGTKVKYYNSERGVQIKHHGFDDLNQWVKVFESWDLSAGDVDAISIVLDSDRNPHIKCDESKLYEPIDIPLFKLLGFDCPVFRVDHHYAHSLSSWPLNIEPDVSFVFDGFGNDQISHSIFKKDKVVLQYRNNEAESLGIILGDVGNILGLKGSPHDLAGKVMAMKGYGNQIQRSDRFTLRTLGNLWNREYIYNKNNSNFKEVFSHIRYCHEETERIYSEHFSKYSSENDLICYSGGIAQNTIINSAIKKVRKNLHVLPHSNDSGLSLGAVEFLRLYYNQEKFDTTGYPYWQEDEKPTTRPSDFTIKETAEKLASGKIVGWYQGNGEVGPRALGNRSILMNPCIKDGKKIINEKVKHREWFRPFGASILEEKTSQYFDWEGTSPYMLYIMNVNDKDSFPSITHVDGTCRIQTVANTENEDYYRLLTEFERLTGLPMLLNTSLNNNGKPICGSITNALDLFSSSALDSLVVGNNLWNK